MLMDEESNINILYDDTFRRMNLTKMQLRPSLTIFHGIIPEKSAYPIRRIKLKVAFCTKYNYKSVFLAFEMVKIKSPYYALFEQPACARFMARPCYVYLKLKMSGPEGTIIARECVREKGDITYAETACTAEPMLTRPT